MFSAEHFIWIAICAVMIGGLVIASIKWKFSFKTATWIVFGIALASEFCKLFTHMNYYEISNGPLNVDGWYLLPKSLPLHLCSILVFFIIYFAFGKEGKLKQTMLNFFVPIGLCGGFLAILLATSGTNFKEPYAYQCFIYHAGIMWYAIYLLMTKKVQIGIHEFIKNTVLLFALAIIMIWVNSALMIYGVNFFFLVNPPAEGLPLLNLKHGWYAYFAHLCFCGLLLEFVVALPRIIKEIKLKKLANEK